MAQLDPGQQLALDQELQHALREWGRLPEVEAEIASWPNEDVLAFVFEWSLEEERLQRLAEHVARRALSTEQLGCFERLMALVSRHRPILDRILNGPGDVATQASA